MTGLQLVEGNVRAKGRVEMHDQSGAPLGDPVDIFLDNILRQAKGGDTPNHHAAQAVRHLI